ncbi:MAG: ABC transporter ATP-binding protein [Anaerolinea sp.]|nr:ABC transporter ATP-binding protein [Anaerolinea sp.]
MSRIEIRHVSKHYGSTEALKDITATISDGKICGLLGRNGAGKTTLLNIITNRIFADQGQVYVNDEPALDNDKIQGTIFYMTEKTLYPKETKVSEVFKITGGFYPTFNFDYAASLSDRFKLKPKKKISSLSTGYLTILKLILTLASNAPITIYDEPVLGLDANHRDLFYKELISHYNEVPNTVILSTHLIEEVARLLEDVIMLREGTMLLGQPVESILQLAYKVSGDQETVDRYAADKKVISRETLGRFKSATLYQTRTAADEEKMSQLGLDMTPAGLQDVFISLTN